MTRCYSALRSATLSSGPVYSNTPVRASNRRTSSNGSRICQAVDTPDQLSGPGSSTDHHNSTERDTEAGPQAHECHSQKAKDPGRIEFVIRVDQDFILGHNRPLTTSGMAEEGENILDSKNRKKIRKRLETRRWLDKQTEKNGSGFYCMEMIRMKLFKAPASSTTILYTAQQRSSNTLF